MDQITQPFSIGGPLGKQKFSFISHTVINKYDGLRRFHEPGVGFRSLLSANHKPGI